MGKKILIDLLKLRELKDCQVEAIDSDLLSSGAFKAIRELATFQYTCRKCKDAPCIMVCPAEALNKDDIGMVTRAVNLCIRCKSCIAICPFGTMMNDLFETKTDGYSYLDVTNESEMKKFSDAFPDEIVQIVEIEADNNQDIFELSEKVLVREFIWDE